MHAKTFKESFKRFFKDWNLIKHLWISPCDAENLSSIFFLHSQFNVKKTKYSQRVGNNSEFSLLFTPPSAWTLCFSVPLFFNPCFILQVPQMNINLRSWKEGSGKEEETLSSLHNASLFHCCWILFLFSSGLGVDCAAERNRHFSDEYIKSISYDQSRQVGLMWFNVKKISTCSQCITEIINNRS